MAISKKYNTLLSDYVELKGSFFNTKETVKELRAELARGQKEKSSLNTQNNMLQAELEQVQKDNLNLSKQMKAWIQKHSFYW